MHKTNFIISYDIAEQKRLRKIAKKLEHVAIRIQYSIFLYIDATQQEIYELIENIKEIIKDDEDDVRIYHIDINRSLCINTAVNLKSPIILKD